MGTSFAHVPGNARRVPAKPITSGFDLRVEEIIRPPSSTFKVCCGGDSLVSEVKETVEKGEMEAAFRWVEVQSEAVL